jgi:hypothetical protein
MNIEKFDNRLFSYSVIIGDANTGNKRLIAADAINNLTMIDNIFVPFVTGTIVINNTKDILQANLDASKAIDFAGNNRDYIAVDIMPNVTGNLEQDAKDDKLRKIFGLTYIFSINELQDSDDASTNLNTMNFRDFKHQTAIENSDFFSSDAVAVKKMPGANLADLNNSERSVLTGELLKNIITTTYGVEEDEIIDKENFDLGSTKIKWYSRGNANAFQNMMYIQSLHQSEQEKDPCLFYFDHSINKFVNISFAKLFELQKTKPEDYVLEAFVIGSGQGSSADADAPGNGAGPRMITYSNILEHKLTPLNGNEFTRNTTNTVCVATAPSDRNFYFNCKSGSIKQILQDYKKLYVEPFKQKIPNIEPSISIEDIEKNKSLRPKIIANVTPLAYENVVRNNMLMDLIVSGGDNIVFRALGSTHRRSGRFIDITTETDIVNSGIGNNLIGRWFVVSVAHVFMGNNYYNIIEAVKTYKYKQTK